MTEVANAVIDFGEAASGVPDGPAAQSFARGHPKGINCKKRTSSLPLLVIVAVVALVLGSFGNSRCRHLSDHQEEGQGDRHQGRQEAVQIHFLSRSPPTPGTPRPQRPQRLRPPPRTSRRQKRSASWGRPASPRSPAAGPNFGSGRTTAGFYLDKGSVVHLKGSVTGGASGTPVFTLPAGYRPGADLLMTAGSGSNILVNVLLSSTGTVSVFCNGACAGSVGPRTRSPSGSVSAEPRDSTANLGSTPDSN